MKTKKNSTELKHVASMEAFEVKTAGKGITIEGFANKATVDRGDEIIATDAWELDNFKRNPIILFNHGLDTLGGTPVGKAIEIRATDEGLYLKVKLSNSEAPGIKMVRDLVEERILKAFSVGFNPKKTDTIDVDGKSVRKISQAELFEVSIVGVPMNQDSLFDISEKSMHQVKAEVLKARGAEKAQRVETILGTCEDRHGALTLVSKSMGIEWKDLLDMLAGNAELRDGVEAAMAGAVKAVNLRATLEDALSKLDDGAEEATVRESLLSTLEGSSEETEDTKPAPPKEGEEGAGKEGGEEDGVIDDPDKKPVDKKPDEEMEKAKADFQACVNATVPKLVAEGMDQDQAVAAAIAKCQEEGKCQLTPESKTTVYARTFAALDTKQKEVVALVDAVEFVKQVDGETQTEQTPTVPIKTEAPADDFGSPFLEAAKQTNALLGAVIVELQKLGNKIGGLVTSGSVSSEDQQPPKEQENSSDESGKRADVAEFVTKRVALLHERLKHLGC